MTVHVYSSFKAVKSIEGELFIILIQKLTEDRKNGAGECH